jgi:microcystin degradation protein MlrC
MRIAIGSLQQESNTLTSRISTYEDFTIYRGKAMIEHVAATDILLRTGCEIVPTLYANAVPGGPLAKRDFLLLANELVSAIPSAGIDGLWLHLHGAMHVVDIGSGEAAILRMIRDRVGPDLPISVALDFHANNTQEFLSLATCVVGYRTAPHIDIDETQQEAAKLLLRILNGSLHPRLGYARIPVVVPGDCVLTAEEPLASIQRRARKLEEEPGMLTCTVFNGQPWVDAPHMGPSVVCYHESDGSKAQQAAEELARMFFEARHAFKFTIEAHDPESALRFAYAAGGERPIFVTDSGDNTTAGAAGDNAFLLKSIVRMDMRDVLIGGLTDADAVRLCERAGEGSRLCLRVGGSIEPASTTCDIDVEVLHVGDIEGWYGEPAGTCAVVRTKGIDIILTANRCAFIRPRIFGKLGLDINAYRFVVVKLGYLYPELAVVAARTILAFTKGTSTERLQDMDMKYITRPVFPLDPI